MVKKIIATLVSVTIALSCLSATVFAEENTSVEDLLSTNIAISDANESEYRNIINNMSNAEFDSFMAHSFSSSTDYTQFKHSMEKLVQFMLDLKTAKMNNQNIG